MRGLSLFVSSLLLGTSLALPRSKCRPSAPTDKDFVDWRTFKANGANLGSWLAKEKTHDPEWWKSLGGAAADTPDEWTLCKVLGNRCGPVLEDRYASFVNKTTIDDLASVGVNLVRITTTYAAWVDVPGSQFHHGNQVKHLRNIASYAISKYGMHVIIGLHSLPGGVNSLDIGEGLGRKNWFFNEDNLEWSYKAVDKILDFIVKSGTPHKFSISPINEASDDITKFATAAGLTLAGGEWVTKYINGVISRTEAVDKRIPVVLQDNFKGTEFWAKQFDAKHNLVLSPHVYYFTGETYPKYTPPAICGQGKWMSEQSKFPTFIGEWSVQTSFANILEVASRKKLFDTQRSAWKKYASGGAFWTAVSYANQAVRDEGTQRDYWSYVDLIKAGVIKKESADDELYCE
ncbi:hypothetical protein FALCPG4_018293 [Fusarium falciforme]